MRKIILINMLCMAILIACEAEIPQSTPSIQIATKTPAVTVIPTRQGAPDLEGESIQINHLCAQSGLSAEENESHSAAVLDFAEYVNAQGGIFGAQIDIEMVDSSSNPQTALATYGRIKRLDDNILIILLCDPQVESVLSPLLAEDGLLAIGTGQAGMQAYASGGALISPNPTSEIHFYFWLEELENHWNAIKPDGAGSEIQLALLTSPDIMPESIYQLENEHVSIVMQTEFDPLSEANIFDFVYNLRDANANAVYIDINGAISSSFMNALNGLGLRDRLLIVGPASSFGSEFENNLFTPEYASGIYFSSPYLWWGSPDMLIAEEIFTGVNRDQSFKNGTYLAALQRMDLAIYAIEESIITDRYEDLNSQTILQWLLSAQEITTLGQPTNSKFFDGIQTFSQLQILQFSEDGNSAVQFQEFRFVSEYQIAPSDQ